MDTMRMDFSSVSAPVAMRFDVPITDDELIEFSLRNKPWRFERDRNGDIMIMTPVGGIGSLHEGTVSSALKVWNARQATGVVFAPNAGFNLPDGSCLAPDAAWLAVERWRSLTRKEQNGFPPLCPEFVIEIRSQSDARQPLEDKMQRWLENGAQLAWLIDPLEKQVVVYRPGEATETLEAPDVVRGHTPVDGFTLEMQSIWEV